MKIELTLIDDWKKAWKLYSVWIFALVLAGPDIYNAAVTAGLISADHVPALFGRLVNIVGFVGIVSRIVKQKSATIASLPEDLQAKVALGMLSQEQADAETADRLAAVAAANAAKAATPAVTPAQTTPGVAVISPIPDNVQAAIDANAAAVAVPAPAPEPAPAPVPVPAPIVAAPVAPPAPVVPATLADALNALSTTDDVAAAVQQQINAEFTTAQQLDPVVHGRVMERVIALTQSMTGKVEALKVSQ